MTQKKFNAANPLCIDLVLREIFGFLCIKDLTNFRLVCKMWNDAAVPNLRERSILKLNYKMIRLSRFLNTMENNMALTLTSSPVLRFSQVSLSCVDFKDSLTIRFLQCHGPYIKSLTLHMISSKLSRYQFWEVLLIQLPNLKELILDKLPLEITDSPGMPYESKLTQNFYKSRLKRLVLQNGNALSKGRAKYSLEFFSDLLKSNSLLEDITNRSSLPNQILLQCIQLNRPYYMGYLHTLILLGIVEADDIHILTCICKEGIFLQHLQLGNLKADVTSCSIQRLLVICAETLLCFNLGDFLSLSTLSIKLPRMKNCCSFSFGKNISRIK